LIRASALFSLDTLVTDNDIIIIIYVNDLLILESNIFNIQALKLQFAERFQMKDLDSIK